MEQRGLRIGVRDGDTVQRDEFPVVDGELVLLGPQHRPQRTGFVQLSQRWLFADLALRFSFCFLSCLRGGMRRIYHVGVTGDFP